MSYLYVTLALPNPAGKDRTPANRVTNEQLNSEWVDFKNSIQQIVSLQGIGLFHYTFNWNCERTGEDQLDTFKGDLQPGMSVRLHTGSGSTYQQGATWHLFAGRSNFAWNNKCGDTVVLRDPNGGVIDWASYNQNPSEGEILRRVAGTNQLR